MTDELNRRGRNPIALVRSISTLTLLAFAVLGVLGRNPIALVRSISTWNWPPRSCATARKKSQSHRFSEVYFHIASTSDHVAKNGYRASQSHRFSEVYFH